MGVIYRLVKWTIRLGMAVLALTIGAVMYFSDQNRRLYGTVEDLGVPFDAVVVLGGGIDGDGVIGYSSRRRVAAAVSLLQAGSARYLILSGGPDWQHRELRAGQLMREYAISLGAPPESLLAEDRAHSTFENLRFSFAIAEREGLAIIAIATDAYHLERARRLAGYFGRPEIGLIAVTGFENEGIGNRVWSIVREALAWWFNLGKVGGWEALALIGIDADARGEVIR